MGVKILVVTKFLAKGQARTSLGNRLEEAGFKPTDIIYESVAPHDWPYDGSLSRADIKEAQFRLADIVSDYGVTHVLSMGNEALQATTGHSGIMNWRGKLMETKLGGVEALATIAPAAVSRNPSQKLNLQADINFFYRAVHNIQQADDEPTPDRYRVVSTKAVLQELLEYLRTQTIAAAFDLETSGFDEQAPGSFVVSMAITTIHSHAPRAPKALQTISDTDMTCWVIPLHHRASVWRNSWEKVLAAICRALRVVPVRVAHNAKFDCRWLAEFTDGVPVNFDTMLAAHMLNENRNKGLKPLARILLGAPEWDIKIKGGKNAPPWYNQHPLKEILWYNTLDTWHTARLYLLFRKDLLAQPRLATLFSVLIMPASQSLVHIERRGVFIDQKALGIGSAQVDAELTRIHDELRAFLPTPEPSNINFGPSNFLRWFLYEHLGLPVLREGKTGPSVAETVLSHIADEHPAVPLLLERVKWSKFRSGFFNPYKELVTSDSRIHTTFKIAGTVTGRLSSGKADAEKVTGTRASALRGVNLQQVPRDKLVRSLFGAAPGWTFIEADYSQVELRIAAFIAQEPTMLTLYATGQDIHMTMAMRMTGKPASEVTSEERKKAKAVNFGFLYGMGWNKFIETAWNNYGLVVTEEEARAFRRAFFEQFPMLIRWHARQRRLAHTYKRVESPLGRVRHLPDIDSPDPGVVAEAERQAINSPVQAMASDLCLLSMVILDRKFRKLNLRAAPIGTVHDAINFEVPDEELDVVIPLIKNTMEHLPLEKLFGVSLTVPIIADMKVGTRWGTGKEMVFS